MKEQQPPNACIDTSNAQVQTLFKDSSTIPTPPQNFVPFLIKSHRFAPQKKYSAIPPIGAYNLPSCFDRKKSPLEDRISHFMLQAQRKKQHMGIFKSSLTRFSKVDNTVPGPATYNLFKIKTGQTEQKLKTVQRKDKTRELGKTCPSIPHQQLKYGYGVVDGAMKSIEKNLEQLQRDRANRKIYASTLQGEKTFPPEQTHHNYHNADYRKQLYEFTEKIVSRNNLSPQTSNSDRPNKKPRYQHLYHSKAVPVSTNGTLGPGQYQINGCFKSSDKQEKFQFFSSTEVRFKDKPNCCDKGYSLIEMIKENNRKSITEAHKQRKPDLKKKSRILIRQERSERMTKLEPGPGQYNPIDSILKKTRGTAVFPCEERFKQFPSEIPNESGEQYLALGQVTPKKQACPGTLKKDRFKPLHQTYNPIKCEQIAGIVVQKRGGDKQNKQNLSAVPNQLKREAKPTITESQHVNCWSRGSGKQKTPPKCYMKELKQQLAIINHSYNPGPSQTPIVQFCKRAQKNKSQFLHYTQS